MWQIVVEKKHQILERKPISKSIESYFKIETVRLTVYVKRTTLVGLR